MSEAKIVLTGEDQTGPAVASAKRNLQQLAQHTEMSAKQMAASMRMVPAQVTDIVTGLASGQKPLTVLIQQGGQLKDMFGGVMPAAKALGTYLTSMINPVTLLAGAGGLVALAWHQATQESKELNKVLILTGNYAGLTAGQLKQIAATGGGVDALVQVAATGKVAGENLAQVTSAAVEMSQLTGRALKEVVADFVQLADEPAKASAKLNEQYHYLTQSVYEHIKALEEEGRADQAAAVAQDAYAKAALERAQRMKDGLSDLEKAWNSVAKAAKDAWAAFKGAVAPDESPEGRLADLAGKISKAKRPFDVSAFGGNAAERAQLPDLLAQFADNFRRAEIGQRNVMGAATSAKAEAEGISATDRVSKLQDQAKGVAAIDRELKKYHDDLQRIREVNPNSALLDPKAIKAGEDAIRKAHQGTVNEYGIDARIKALQGQLQQEERALKMTLDQIKVDYEVGLLTTNQYLDKQYEAKQAALERELVIVRQQQEIARGKKNTAALEQYRNEEKKILDEIEGNFVKHASDVRVEAAKAQRAVDAYMESLSAQYRTRQASIDDALAGAGLSDRDRANQQALNAVRREYDQKADDLRRQRQKGEANGGINEDVYQRELAALKDYYKDRLAQEQDYNAKEAVLRGDWTLGAKKAYADYAEGARDAAGQANRAFTNGLQSMEDAIVSLVTTGKANVKSMVTAWIAELARMKSRQLLTEIFGDGKSMNGSLLEGMGKLIFGGGGGSAAISDSAPGAAEIFFASAKGNVFQTPGLAAFSNRIVNRPTMFAFARGAGLMGEAGPEAIMPLRRGPDGRLGVDTSGGGKQHTLVVNNYMTVGDVASRQHVEEQLRQSEQRTFARFSRATRYGTS